MERFRVGEIVQVRDVGWYREQYGVVVRIAGDRVRVQTTQGTIDKPSDRLVNERLSGFRWAPSDEIRRLAERVQAGGTNDTFALPDSVAPDDPLQTGRSG